MKTIHDLKNPAMALAQIINEQENQTKTVNEISKLVNTELEDLNDMLDNLRAEFKQKYGMKIDEQPREIKSSEFLRGIRKTHQRLASNGRNKLEISCDEKFPKLL